MFILMNPYAGGGTAARKWPAAKERLGRRAATGTIVAVGSPGDPGAIMTDALNDGERTFVAAGGDGTINMLLNMLIHRATPDQLAEVRMGAIGLGSSNDFHKPAINDQLSGGISYKMDFDAAMPRDIGSVRTYDDGAWSEHFFLVNASVGTTAEANSFFNHPDRMLRTLKEKHTSGAILYAAMRTILRHRDIPAWCAGPGCGMCPVSVSALGVYKNPHFSGSLSYGGSPCYDDGLLNFRLYEGLGAVGLVRLLAGLAGRNGHARRASRAWASPFFTLSSPFPFAVEFDGEVTTAREVAFSVLPKYLKVCP